MLNFETSRLKNEDKNTVLKNLTFGLSSGRASYTSREVCNTFHPRGSIYPKQGYNCRGVVFSCCVLSLWFSNSQGDGVNATQKKSCLKNSFKTLKMILWQFNFFWTNRHSKSIIEMDFERVFEATFFEFNLNATVGQSFLWKTSIFNFIIVCQNLKCL